MKLKIYLMTIVCLFLTVSMPIVFAALSVDRTVERVGDTLQGQPLTNNPLIAGYSTEQYLGEAITLSAEKISPTHVRESMLEQQDVLVFAKLEGTTVCSLLSQFSANSCITDPITGIGNIPPIDSIVLIQNTTSKDYNN